MPLSCCSAKVKRRLGAALAAVLLLAGVTVIVCSGILFRMVERSALVIRPGSQVYPDFVNVPFPVVTSIYVFNVTNAAAVTSEGAKPRLVELGPYVYHEHHNRTKIEFNPENGTVTFQQARTYHFRAEASSGSLEDEVVTLNVPAAAINEKAADTFPVVRRAIDVLLKNLTEELFVRKTVRELLFDGYRDPLLDKLPPWVPAPRDMPDKFAYYYGRNGSDWTDGVFNMFTGETGLSKLGLVARWNYTSKLPYYEGSCGQVRGGGDVLPPGCDRTSVEFFSNDLCRPMRLDFESSAVYREVDVYAYTVTDMFFANESKNRENWCFDPNHRRLPSGVFDIGPCRQDAPVLMSQPHFYQADPFYLRQVSSGLSPAKGRHETRFLVEPATGIPAKVLARFQVNLFLRKVKDIELFRFLRDRLFVPTVWFEAKVELSEEAMRSVNDLSRLGNVFRVCGGFLIVVSLFAASVLALNYYFRRKAEAAADDGAREDLFSEEEEGNQESAIPNETGAENVEESY